MNNYFNNVDIFQLIIKWKKHLIITTLSSIIATIFFTSPIFIKPKFKAVAIIYPVNITSFGSESTVEQMIQIMQSDEIQFKIAKKFDLIKHYDIDPESDYARTKLLKELEDNSTFSKTEFESVEVQVLDTDPKLAADIVNAYIDNYNLKERSLQRSKIQEMVTIVKNQFDKKKLEMDSVEAKLKDLRVKYGLLNYDAQTRVVAKNYFKSMKNSSSDFTKVFAMKKNLEEKGGEFMALSEHAYRIRAMYNDLKVQYEGVLKDFQKELTYASIITPPYPADKKTTPVRWLIALIAVFSSFVFAMVVIYLIENAKVKDILKQS